MMKSRKEIVDLLGGWVKNGDIVSKVELISSGLTYPEIDRKIAAGEYLATSCTFVLCRTEVVRKAFEGLWDGCSIMDGQRCMAKKGYLTQYAIDKACKDGELYRFDLSGKKSILYVD